jgi:hypothetical protein
MMEVLKMDVRVGEHVEDEIKRAIYCPGRVGLGGIRGQWR